MNHEHSSRVELPSPRSAGELGLKDLEQIRLILRGGSVIEWPRLHFRDRAEVARFLEVCEIDTRSEADVAWVRHVLREAVEYLRRTFKYRVAAAVAEPESIEDLFLFASGVGPRAYRRIACVVLKVMHVIQHIEGRDLIFRLAVSEAELSQLVIEKVMGVAVEMLSEGFPFTITEFTDSVKTRESVITKLLAKKETVAAKIYDFTRFRIITARADEIAPVVAFLTERLIPFNFVVPGQTENTLVDFGQLVRRHPLGPSLRRQLHLDLDYEREVAPRSNTFSARNYRMLNFVADLPVRLDALLPAEPERPARAKIGFCMVEFQICDAETARLNQTGESSHRHYKARQKKQVLQRLSKGLVVPRHRQRGGEGPA